MISLHCEVSFTVGFTVWTTAEQTTVSPAVGVAWETRSNQERLCLAREETELWEVIVLTGEDRVPVASLGTGEEYGGGRLS